MRQENHYHEIIALRRFMKSIKKKLKNQEQNTMAERVNGILKE